MKKHIFLIISLISVFGFTSCSDNNLHEPESTQTSARRELDTNEENKEEAFSNIITTETVESPNINENNANTEEFYDVSTNVSQAITESESLFEDAEIRFNPFSADINQYSGKEVSFVCFYFIKRYPLSYTDDGKDFSVLYGYSDGTCKAEIFTNKDYFTPFTDTDIFSFDEINEPISVLSEELEALDSDTIKNINVLMQQIDFGNEYIDHYPDSRNPNIEHPAVDPEYDIVDFYAADKDGNLHRILYDYVYPDCFEADRSETVQIELDDENAKQAGEILINSDAFRYWLENYACKIGK